MSQVMQLEFTTFQNYRKRAIQQRDLARKEQLPNVRQLLEASAERWEILAERFEAAGYARVLKGLHAAPVVSGATRRHDSPPAIRIGKLVIDRTRKTVAGGRGALRLTEMEWAVLELLALHQGAIVTKAALLDHIYCRRNRPDPKTLNVFVCRLRKKLADVCGAARCIETINGSGYRLTEPVAEPEA